MTKFAWNEENTAVLKDAISGVSLVTQDMLKDVAEEIGHTARGVGSKIRQLVKVGEVSVEVQKASEAHKSTFAAEDEGALVDFIEQNAGAMTYTEISATFLSGKYTPKQIQGKVLSLELTDKVKKAEKPVAVRTYSEADEATFVEMANAGASLEDISEKLGRPLNSIRGKALSLHREGRIADMPHQAQSNAKGKEDILAPVMDKLDEMTIEEIAEATGKTARGIKGTLTRRGLSCKDHNGASKREKLDAKAAKAE